MPAGRDQRLQPRRDVDAVTEDVVALEDDIAEMDADAEAMRRRPRVATLCRHARFKSTALRTASTTLGKAPSTAVAGGVDNAAAMLGDRGDRLRAPRGPVERQACPPRRRPSAGCSRRRRRRGSPRASARRAHPPSTALPRRSLGEMRRGSSGYCGGVWLCGLSIVPDSPRHQLTSSLSLPAKPACRRTSRGTVVAKLCPVSFDMPRGQG